MEHYECQGCGARSESEADASARYCRICGRAEPEVLDELARRVRLARHLERAARDRRAA